MALFSSYRWRRGRRHRGRYARSRARSRGQYRAANQQRDSGTFVINAATTANVTSSNVTFVSVYDILRKSEFFNNYANMYDQFKVNRIRVKLTQGNATNGAFTLVSAWDRNGLDANNLTKSTTNNSIAFNADQIANVRTYSSAVTKSVSNGSSFSMIRYLSPSTMQEKSQWISPSNLLGWYDTFAADSNYIMYQISSESTDSATLLAARVSSNPTFPQTSSSVPFKPIFLMTLWAQATSTAVYNLEFDISVTFRGMRKSSVV